MGHQALVSVIIPLVRNMLRSVCLEHTVPYTVPSTGPLDFVRCIRCWYRCILPFFQSKPPEVKSYLISGVMLCGAQFCRIWRTFSHFLESFSNTYVSNIFRSVLQNALTSDNVGLPASLVK